MKENILTRVRPGYSSVIRDVYGMLGQDSFGQTRDMFEKMDKDKDGKITEEEFIRASLEDQELVRMLSTHI